MAIAKTEVFLGYNIGINLWWVMKIWWGNSPGWDFFIFQVGGRAIIWLEGGLPPPSVNGKKVEGEIRQFGN